MAKKWITERTACRAAGVPVAEGQCPGCGENGSTSHDGRWRAAVESIPAGACSPIPDTPAQLCWDCRVLAAVGVGYLADTLRVEFQVR